MIDMESNTTLVQCYPAHEAVPGGDGPFPPILVLHDRFGLNTQTRNVANRLAHAGFYALAPDLYCSPSSFSAVSPEFFHPLNSTSFGYEEEAAAKDRAATLADERVSTIVNQALAFLAGRSKARSGGAGLFGLGTGGRAAFLAACLFPEDVRAAVCLAPAALNAARPGGAGRLSPLDRATALAAPVVLFYGLLDTNIRPEERETVRRRLVALGKNFRIDVIPGADHDFFYEDRDSYRIRASKIAWDETLSFFRRQVGATATLSGP